MPEQSGTPAPKWLLACFSFLSYNWGTVAFTLGSILLGAAGAPEVISGSTENTPSTPSITTLPWTAPQWLFVSGVILTLAGLAKQIFRRPSYGQLIESRDLAQANALERAGAAEGVLRAILAQLAESLELTGPTIRLSVYCHEQSEFVLLSRMSTDQILKRRGRPSYPDDQGVIGLAWKKGTAVLVDLPEQRDLWLRQLGENGIDEATAKSLSMQSRSLIGVRMDATEGGEVLPVGVLVFESTTARGVHSRTVDKLRTDDSWPLLINAMYNARNHFPGVARALVPSSTSN